MRWRDGRRSNNVEDRRGTDPGTGGYRRGGLRLPVGRRTAGGGLGLLLVVVLALVFGVDPRLLLSPDGGVLLPPLEQPAPGGTPHGRTQDATRANVPGSGPGSLGRAREDELADFVAVVLGDTEDVWGALFRDSGARYREPQLVLFTDAVRSACGRADASMGPFYCSGDEKVYIDLGFFDELEQRFKAPGDFAQAYVIAHEVGHHVQHLLGISGEVTRAQQAAGGAERNRLSVMLELQADCLAGVWAHHAQRARQILEAGDIDEGLNAAAQIGDDRMQRRSTGFVVPDSFTHGSSEQRARWFRRGLTDGDPNGCNTFQARAL